MYGEDKKIKILIVEDSETQIIVLRHILEEQGWKVTWANSAEKALEMLSKKEITDIPSLIIIDYHLPGIKGDELCRRLKLNIDTRSIPTLMLSAEDNEEIEANIMESGADEYVPKDSDDEILILKINSLLKRSEKNHVMYGIGSSLFQHSRILAVDDSPTYLEFLDESFKEDGFHLDKTTSGLEALEKIKKKKYDCVMVDLVMPEIDGIEMCHRILEMRRFLKKPMAVLMLTAHENKDDMTRALEAGADDFVGKSSDISIIKARMTALLRRKFILEDNQRIFEELKRKELEIERSRIEKNAAEIKGVLAEKLLKTVEQLEEEIEERKHMEQKIKEYSQELERSNRELEAFAYVASHDLQEPLRAISSYLQLVDKRYKDKLDEKAGDFINRAVNGALRMQEMINDLLLYSRITTRGKFFALNSLEKLLERSLDNLSAAIYRKKAIITHSPLPELICDDSQILRLFQNLISNAIKFCTETPIIHIAANKQKKQWLFSIKDNGIGIDPSHKELIFKIFHRLHGKNQYSGTGIGLAICQKIVERHNGRIWVESQPEEKPGATFFFTLGTRNPEDAVKEPPSKELDNEDL